MCVLRNEQKKNGKVGEKHKVVHKVNKIRDYLNNSNEKYLYTLHTYTILRYIFLVAVRL